MNSFKEWLAATPLGGAFKTFIAVILGAAIADWAGAGAISLGNWETWVIAGLVSAVPVIINWLNGTDGRYGKVDQ